MLRLVPQSWFSWNFDVLENDLPVAEIKVSPLRERGTLVVDGAAYEAYREGLASGEFILEQNGHPIARAQKPSAFFNSFHVEVPGKNYTLKKESMVGRPFVLLDNDEVAGSIRPEGVVTRKAAVDLPEDVPVPVKIFIVWLVLLMWKREANAAAAAASS